MFTVGGKQFILLNEYRDENSAYYVMAEDCYGRHVYDPDDTQRFDPEDENNIGYFLNNEFVTDGNEEQMLPQAIIEHINFSHVWQNEAGHSNGNCPSDYSFTAGIALISKTEYGKYFGKIGWDAPGEWWTRTARAKDANNMNIMAMTIGSGGGDIWDRNASRDNIYIRPVFYLDRSFFADVRISDIGANVAQAMTDNYSLSELLSGGAGYTEEELEALGILKTPDAQNVMIEGNAAVNSVLKGSYTYSHELNKPEDGSIYGFEISSDNQSFSTAAENTFDYQVKGSDNGKYIRFFCTPVDSDGISGEKVVSNTILISYTQDMAVTSITGDGIRDGKRLSELSSIAPVIEITNYSGETKQAVCIAAVYDANDRIIAMDSSVVEVTDTATVNGLSLSLSGLGSAAYARVFVVDSYADMNSLMGYEVVIR